MASPQTTVDDYDPHDYRAIQKPTTNWQTMAHFLKASIGTGVLAMPNAFANAGYINGIIMTSLISTVCLYCKHILIRSMYLLCKKDRVPYLTYSESMAKGFKEGPQIFRFFVPVTTAFVDGFLAFYQFGICCVYVLFISESNKQIVDEYFVVLDLRVHICIMLIPLLMIFSIRSLRFLAFFTSFANFTLIFGFGVILYYIFEDLPSLSERKAFADIGNWPILFGVVLFAVEAVGVVVSIEENMATPKAFLTPFGILNVGMFIIICLYVCMGFFGYWKYGDESQGSVTLNIPQDEIMSQVTKAIFAFSVLITYALQGYVTNDIIWHKYLSKKVEDTSKHLLYELCIRAILVFATFIFAMIFPSLSLFLAFVGSFCMSLLGIVFPALLQMCIHYNTGYGPFKIQLIKNILLCLFGIMGGVIGTYVTVLEMIHKFYL